MAKRPAGQAGALAVVDDRAGRLPASVLDAPDDDRPLCRVVGHYCEALGWLRREPSPAARCCRHYWADAEGGGRDA